MKWSIISCIAVSSAVALLYTLYSAYYIYKKAEVSRTISKEHVAFTNQVGTGSLRIAVLGDSTAVGIGAKSGSNAIAGVFAQAYPQATVTLCAQSGVKAAELLEQCVPLQNKATLTVLQIGANDILRFTNKKEFSQTLRTLFTQAKAKSEHVVALHSGNIGLAPIFKWPASWLLTWRTQQIRTIYKQIAKQEGVLYVDLYTTAANDNLKPHNVHYAADQLHLTAAGYKVWFNAIMNTLRANNVTL